MNFHNLPNSLSQFQEFPKQGMDAKTALFFIDHMWRENLGTINQGLGRYGELIFKNYDTWVYKRNDIRIILIQGINKNNFYFLGLYDENTHDTKYIQKLCFLEKNYAYLRSKGSITIYE